MATVTVPTEWVNSPAYDAQFIGAFKAADIPLFLGKNEAGEEVSLDWSNLKTVDGKTFSVEKQGATTVYTVEEPEPEHEEQHQE